jgi:hypothetical protein
VLLSDGARVRPDNELYADGVAALAGVLGQMPQLQELNLSGTFVLRCEGRMFLGRGRGLPVAGSYERVSDLSIDV